MKTNIKSKILEVNDRVVKGDTGLSRDIARDGLAAIFSGMYAGTGEVTPEWRQLMTHFASDQNDLDRLCGKHEKFNASKWGKFCLAYIAGDSTCTSDTTMRTGVLRSMQMRDEIAGNTELQDSLDADFGD